MGFLRGHQRICGTGAADLAVLPNDAWYLINALIEGEECRKPIFCMGRVKVAKYRMKI